MKEVPTNPDLVAKCGLYCGACSRYLKEKCAGCEINQKLTWCKIRACCIENEYRSCAECKEVKTPKECKRYISIFNRTVEYFFNSDRIACINEIKNAGYDDYAIDMASNKFVSIKRRRKK